MSERKNDSRPCYDDKIWGMVCSTLVHEKTEELGHTPSAEELEPEMSQLKDLFERDGDDA